MGMVYVPEIDYVGVAKLRQRMSAGDLKALARPILITGPGNTEPLALLIPYRQWIEIQGLLQEGAVISLRDLLISVGVALRGA